jgi:hypothetical protein
MPKITRRLAALEGISADSITERLRAALASKLNLSAWSTGGSQHGYSVTLETSWNGYAVQWTLRFSVVSKAVELDVSATDEISELALSSLVNELLLGVLDDAITGSTTRFSVRRQFVYQGPPLDGEYWIGNMLRVAPHERSRSLRRGWVSQLLVMDLSVAAVDKVHAWAIASDRASTVAAWLSLILDIGVRVPPREWVWTSVDERGTDGDWRYWTSPPAPRFLNQMPARGAECPLGQYTGNLRSQRDGGRNLCFPQEIRRIIRFADNAPAQLRKAFDGCCRLYQLSNVIPHEFVSARLALRVSAAEALAKVAEPGGSFSAFMRARSPLIQVYPELLEILYGALRSGLFHAGSLYLNDLIRPHNVADFDAMRRRDEEARGEAALRDAIITWLLSNIEPRRL